MKNFTKSFKKILYNACLYFTVAIFVILLMADLAEISSTYSFLSLGSTALVFLACLLMSALNTVWKLDYSPAVRVLIHFTGSFVIYGIVFILIPKVYTNASQLVIRTAVFVMLYLLIAFIAAIVSGIKRNRRSDNMEYESQFGNFFDK